MSRKVSELNHIHPLDCPIVAQVRSEFADCTWFYDHGYIRYNDGTKIMLREHQRVALVKFGATDGFHIHHIDGNPLNNCADNLTLLTPAEHSHYHASQQKAERIYVVCPICGKTFESILHDFERRGKRYCSVTCRSMGDRRTRRPSKERLAELLVEIGNWSALGRMFGLSDNAIRKWAKSYELDLSVCDGRRK